MRNTVRTAILAVSIAVTSAAGVALTAPAAHADDNSAFGSKGDRYLRLDEFVRSMTPIEQRLYADVAFTKLAACASRLRRRLGDDD